MIPNGFGDAITGFENPYRQSDSHTPYLTGGPTPWSTSSRPAFAFAFASHRVSTFATHGYWMIRGKPLFLYPLFTGLGPVHGLGHDHGRGPVLGVVGVEDLDWRFGWMCGARKVALPHLRRLW